MIAEAAEVVEDIVNQIAQKPGLLHEVMTAEGKSIGLLKLFTFKLQNSNLFTPNNSLLSYSNK